MKIKVEEIHTDTNEIKSDDPEPPGCHKVGITYNLKKNISSELPDAEAEFDDMDTIKAIQNALESAGYTVVLYEATEDLPARLLQNRPDMVFNVAEGSRGRGREAQVPAILSFLDIPYTGSDETTLGIAMDKAITKRLTASWGVDTPRYRVFKSSGIIPDAGSLNGNGFSWPVIVKPNTEGSSKGISDVSVANDAAALQRVLAEKISTYKEDMLVEEYISGREFTVGILGNGAALRVFTPMEIVFGDKSHSIYSYEVKRNFRQFVRYECPPNIGLDLQNEMEETAKTVYNALECRDLARMDFRLSPDGKLFFIEINPLPGLAPGYSDFPMLAGFCGMDYTTLILNILESALTRYGLRHHRSQSMAE